MQHFFRFFLRYIPIFILASVLIACQSTQTTTAPAENNTATNDEAPLPEVVFVGQEYSFEGPESVPSGWTQITLDNQGELAHDLILFKLDEGKTMDDVMTVLESEQQDEDPPEWIELYGQISADPGTRTMFIADLTPGNYGMISFGESPDGPPDAAQGMVAGLTVTNESNGATEATLPQSEASIELVDYSFVANGLQSGEQLVRISNTGTEPHEVIIQRIKEGKTFAEVQALLNAEISGEKVSDAAVEEVLEYAGSAMLAPGRVNYTHLTLEPGTYVLLCFLPSEGHEGKAHYELGMVQQVTVE